MEAGMFIMPNAYDYCSIVVDIKSLQYLIKTYCILIINTS